MSLQWNENDNNIFLTPIIMLSELTMVHINIYSSYNVIRTSISIEGIYNSVLFRALKNQIK